MRSQTPAQRPNQTAHSESDRGLKFAQQDLRSSTTQHQPLIAQWLFERGDALPWSEVSDSLCHTFSSSSWHGAPLYTCRTICGHAGITWTVEATRKFLGLYNAQERLTQVGPQRRGNWQRASAQIRISRAVSGRNWHGAGVSAVISNTSCSDSTGDWMHTK